MLVFGDANGFRPRDEFTIDFEGLDRAVCATLDAFLDNVTSDAAYKRATKGRRAARRRSRRRRNYHRDRYRRDLEASTLQL